MEKAFEERKVVRMCEDGVLDDCQARCCMQVQVLSSGKTVPAELQIIEFGLWRWFSDIAGKGIRLCMQCVDRL